MSLFKELATCAFNCLNIFLTGVNQDQATQQDETRFVECDSSYSLEASLWRELLRGFQHDQANVRVVHNQSVVALLEENK